MRSIVIFLIAIISILSFPLSSVFAAGNEWEIVTNLPQNVNVPNSPVAITLENTVLIAGISSDVLMYNTLTKKWSQSQRFPSVYLHANPSIIKLNIGKILVIGTVGFGENSFIPAQIYDPSTMLWENTGTMFDPVRVNHASILLPNGKVLVTGGYGASMTYNAYHLASNVIYDDQNNTWTQTDSLNENRSNHTISMLQNGKVLITGGRGNNFTNTTVDFTRSFGIKSAELFDIQINSWKQTNDMAQARVGHTATVLKNGKVLITGGSQFDDSNSLGKSRTLASTEIYDPSTELWEPAANMQMKRVGHSATLLRNGNVLVTGGFNGEYGSENALHAYNTAEIYDVKSNTWKLVSSMKSARANHAAIALPDGSVFVAGGIFYPINQFGELQTEENINSAEIYHPEEIIESDQVEPFLELPLDYQGQGKTFEEVALNPVSWFDHSYPLQNVTCCVQSITKYNFSGDKEVAYYQSHNGYDYAKINGVTFGTAVLAAADGIASFVPSAKSGGGGNVIKIDHENGYQSWYEHLDSQDLILSSESNTIRVKKGDQIGRVGMTGNTTGPHIHFSVIRDRNENGTFIDDYPYGLVDPLGWEGKDSEGKLLDDPWEAYTNNQNHGSKSISLFTQKQPQSTYTISPNGNVIKLGQYTSIQIPQGMVPQFYTLTTQLSGYVAHKNLLSAAPSFFVYARDIVGNMINKFIAPVELLFTYTQSSVTNINEDTLSMYFYNENAHQWEALPSKVDKNKRTVRALTNHFSHFALMGQKIDTKPPTTQISLIGKKEKQNIFKSNVTLSFFNVNEKFGDRDILIFYSINQHEFELYKKPIEFTNDGKINLEYFSIDKFDNKEAHKKLQFEIAKTKDESHDSNKRKNNIIHF